MGFYQGWFILNPAIYQICRRSWSQASVLSWESSVGSLTLSCADERTEATDQTCGSGSLGNCFDGSVGKESTCQCSKSKKLRFDPWVRKIFCGRKWRPIPVFLPGKSHGQRSLVSYSPKGHKELDRTDYTHTHTRTHAYMQRQGQTSAEAWVWGFAWLLVLFVYMPWNQDVPRSILFGRKM